MPLHLFPTLLFYVVLVAYSPGPANLYSFTCSLKYGRKSALLMWRGLLIGFLLVVSIAAFFCYFLGATIDPYVGWLKYLGATYILWLAYKLWNNPINNSTNVTECSFISGVVMQLTNVKMIIFDFTVFSIFVLPYSNKLHDLLIVSAILLFVGSSSNLVWLLAGSFLHRFFSKTHKWIDYVMTMALVACAVIILLQ